MGSFLFLGRNGNENQDTAGKTICFTVIQIRRVGEHRRKDYFSAGTTKDVGEKNGRIREMKITMAELEKIIEVSKTIGNYEAKFDQVEGTPQEEDLVEVLSKWEIWLEDELKRLELSKWYQIPQEVVRREK